MNDLKKLEYDFRFHFRSNKKIYFMFFLSLFVGILIGFLVSVSKAGYSVMLSSKDKVFLGFINGTESISQYFWKIFYSSLVPAIFIFLFNFFYHLSFISLVYVSYQGCIFILSSLAIASTYGFVGLLKSLILIIPINIIYFLILSFEFVICHKRAKQANKFKSKFYGFDNEFFLEILIIIILILVLSFVVGIIVPLLLKNANLIIF